MTDITNLQGHNNGAHVQRIIYKMTDSKELNLEIVWKRGKEEESEKYVLTTTQ